MWQRLTLSSLLITLFVSASCSKTSMRTLYKGPVEPPATGEEFDMRHWLKSAMPKREERCTGNSKEIPATCDLNDLPDIANTERVGCGKFNGTIAPYGTNCTLKCINGQVPSKDVHEACGPDVDSTGLIEPSVATILCQGEWLIYKHLGVEYKEIIPDDRFDQRRGIGKDGRLNGPSGWCDDSSSGPLPVVRLGFLSSTLLSGVITQGHNTDDRRALTYLVQGMESSNFKSVKDPVTGYTKIFNGNINDSNTPVIQLFPKATNLTEVSIVPYHWFDKNTQQACLRFELLGHRLN